MTNTGHIPQHATAALVFSDGSVFYGYGIGAKGTTLGEICFNTGLTGYQEILTDLSYAGQIVTFTFPHIGNVGTNDNDMEAKTPAAKGLIVRENITNPSNYRNTQHLDAWLKDKNLTGIAGVDTRAITRLIRKNGAQNVAICYFENTKELNTEQLKHLAGAHASMKGLELAAGVSLKKSKEWAQGGWDMTSNRFENNKDAKFKVVAIDYGAKLNILRSLVKAGCDVTVVPAKTSADTILAHKPDGIFLSNGPGDPSATAHYAIPELQKLVEAGLPMFGICLGHQLLSLALGCQTKKMPQGHRGSNHPVQDLHTRKVEITSQNHGFVVCDNMLPADVEVTHRSLFDGTVEGVRSKTKPIFTVQYHPEASPGPQDSYYLFERFVKLMEKAGKAAPKAKKKA